MTKKFLITEDVTGINPSELDIVNLLKKPSKFSSGYFGEKYPNFKASQISIVEKVLEEDSEVAFFTPLYITLEGKEIKEISLEPIKDNPWDSGIGAYIVYSKSFLKEKLGFKRVYSSTSAFSKKRVKEILDYTELQIESLNAFVKGNLYTVLKEVDGKVEDEITGIHGSNEKEVANRAANFLLGKKEKFKDFSIELIGVDFNG